MAKMTQSKGMKNICAVGFVVSLMSPPLRRDWARPSPREDDTWKAEPRYPVVPADIQLTADTWGGVAQTSRTEMLPVVYHWGCLLPSIIVVKGQQTQLWILWYLIWATSSFPLRCTPFKPVWNSHLHDSFLNPQLKSHAEEWGRIQRVLALLCFLRTRCHVFRPVILLDPGLGFLSMSFNVSIHLPVSAIFSSSFHTQSLRRWYVTGLGGRGLLHCILRVGI